jgi:uncharacterized protein YcbX
VHLVTTASLRALGAAHGSSPIDWRRSRANLLVDWPGDAYVEESWVDGRLGVGDDLVLEVVMPMPRCAMVNAPALDVLPEPRLLHTIRKANGGNLGILAEVVRPGVVRRGDQLRLLG